MLMSLLLTVGVDFVDHVLKLRLCGVLTERPHDGAQLFSGDGAVAILVEERERLLELGDLFLCQLIGLQKHTQNSVKIGGHACSWAEKPLWVLEIPTVHKCKYKIQASCARWKLSVRYSISPFMFASSLNWT